jgi:hypothetical protein
LNFSEVLNHKGTSFIRRACDVSVEAMQGGLVKVYHVDATDPDNIQRAEVTKVAIFPFFVLVVICINSGNHPAVQQ